MTESLTDRLQKRLSTQTDEIEALTSAELTRLASRLRQQCSDALTTMEDAIHDTRLRMDHDLKMVLSVSRWIWIALLATWLLIGIFSIALWMRPGPETGMENYQTFTANGQTFLILPEGTEATSCRNMRTKAMVECVALPRGN